VKSLFIDWFAPAIDVKVSVFLKELKDVIVLSTTSNASDDQDSFTFRRYLMKGPSTKIALQERGPSFTLRLDRAKAAENTVWRKAMQLPKELRPKKRKNVASKETGQKRGKLHLGKQVFDQIHTVHHGESKKKKLRLQQQAAAPAAASAAGDGSTSKSADSNANGLALTAKE